MMVVVETYDYLALEQVLLGLQREGVVSGFHVAEE